MEVAESGSCLFPNFIDKEIEMQRLEMHLGRTAGRCISDTAPETSSWLSH